MVICRVPFKGNVLNDSDLYKTIDFKTLFMLKLKLLHFNSLSVIILIFRISIKLNYEYEYWPATQLTFFIKIQGTF